MGEYRIIKAPDQLGRGPSNLGNVAVVPANLLPFKAQWQPIANSLPHGGILVVLPAPARQREIVVQVAEELRKIGRNVTTMSAEAHELVAEG
jgi:hypothetical protein